MDFNMDLNVTILVDKWTTIGVWDLLGSCAAIFVLAVLYEGLKVLRDVMTRSSVINIRYFNKVVSKNLETTLSQTFGSRRSIFCSWSHMLQTFLHVWQVAIGYFLMLVIMTCNLWLSLAVLTGAAVGYLMFGWRREVVVDITEPCNR